MNLHTIITRIPQYIQLEKTVKSGKRAAVLGCAVSFRAAACASLIADTGRPAVVICAGEAEAARFAADLRQFLPEGVFFLPSLPSTPGT